MQFWYLWVSYNVAMPLDSWEHICHWPNRGSTEPCAAALEISLSLSRSLSLSLSYFHSCRTSELLCKCQTERNVAPLRSRSLFTSFDIPSAIDDDRPPRSPAHACATGRDRYGMLSTAKVTSSIQIGRIFRIQPGIECLIKFWNSFSHWGVHWKKFSLSNVAGKISLLVLPLGLWLAFRHFSTLLASWVCNMPLKSDILANNFIWNQAVHVHSDEKNL